MFRLSRREGYVALGSALALVVALVAWFSVSRVAGAPPATPAEPTMVLQVSPTGADGNDGSPAAPLRTIQAALQRAIPGALINLAPGVYHEQLTTVRDGAPGLPITIKGPETGKDRSGRYRAVLYGTGRIISVNHSHHTFQGFTIDGQERLANEPYPTDLAAIDAFKDRVQPQVADGRLIYVGAADTSRDITGTTIADMFLNGAGGECVRLRNNAHGNVISDSVIQYCGMFGKGDGGDRARYHNGEGVYIGTSPKSKKQPMYRNDTSSDNLVTRSVIRTFGSECFNVKENAHDNVFADNECSGNTESADHDGSNIELRGHDNVIRGNRISDSAGYTLKIKSDGEEYDRGGNVIEGNRLAGSAAALMIESAARQGAICGNEVFTPVMVEGDGFTADLSAPC